MTCLRRIVATLLAVAVLDGCSPFGPDLGASVTTILGGPVTMTFAGTNYTGVGATLAMPDPPDPDSLVIPQDALRLIGLATDADPMLFPDRQVFAIRGVEPRDAVVMFDRSTPKVSIEMVVFIRPGTDPTRIPGLCDYYAAPPCGGVTRPRPREGSTHDIREH